MKIFEKPLIIVVVFTLISYCSFAQFKTALVNETVSSSSYAGRHTGNDMLQYV